jgi:hypothetical protein
MPGQRPRAVNVCRGGGFESDATMDPWLYEAGLSCGIAFVASQRPHVFLLLCLSFCGFDTTICCLNLALSFGFPLYYLFVYSLVT